MKWEYRKIALNDRSRGADEIDVLCKAGKEGWELVAVLANNVAYLKRRVDGPSDDGLVDENRQERAHEVAAKYRDPATGETWSGRGRMARWLKTKQDGGEDIQKYRI